ncbi:MAG: transcription elongation factor GreA [Pseudomonadota bacterium]|nr:transcription elongation factor GreA [Pseudomonadota bacterium]
MNKTPMTILGAEALKDELRRRKTIERSRISSDIAEARAHGDLKENAEYHAAREQQSFNEGRIADIEAKLSNSEIIDVTKVHADGRIIFGSTVRLANSEDGSEVTYRIVGEDEADIKLGLVSIASPISRAVIGKRKGEYAVVAAPKGETEYEILGVEYI